MIDIFLPQDRSMRIGYTGVNQVGKRRIFNVIETDDL